MIQSSTIDSALIGVFDVLGAKSCFDMSTSDDIRIFTSFFRDAITISSCSYFSDFQNAASSIGDSNIKANIQSIIDAIRNHSSLSCYGDTIIYIIALQEIPPAHHQFVFSHFLAQVESITCKMFDHGFPLRGCLDLGLISQDYTVPGSPIITGKPYVNAISCSDNLEFSGVVITKCFIDQLHAIPANECLKLSEHIIDLYVQTKHGEALLSCLDWLNESRFLRDTVDIRQLLFESFSAHHKLISSSVSTKINNTENVIRQMLQRRHSLVSTVKTGGASAAKTA